MVDLRTFLFLVVNHLTAYDYIDCLLATLQLLTSGQFIVMLLSAVETSSEHG